jgi:hypothetical protein
MQMKKKPAKRLRTTIASVKREMLKPRLTASVRDALGYGSEPVVEKSSTSPRKV